MAVAILLVIAPAALRAQSPGRLVFFLPGSDPLPAAFVVPVRAEGFADAPRPLSISLEIATTTTFLNNAFSDTRQGDSVSFVMTRPLPENATLFFRFRARDASGRLLDEGVAGPRRTGPRLTLVSPAGAFGVTLFTVTPTFVWRSAPITVPPGPWVYDLRVVESSTGAEAIVVRGITDTTYTPAAGLQANAPYRWSVTARLPGGFPEDAVTLSSPSNFIIRAENAPVATLLYQNFPNPFPTPDAAATCIWFDLHRAGRVQLTVHDLRGNLVRQLVPGRLGADLAAGAYGRAGEGANSGCDERLSWDGSDEAGRKVPAGLYLLRFRANGKETYKKMLYRGG